MYLYIYDNFLTEKKYQSLLYKIENRLVDLDIKGRVVRLNILKNMRDVVDSGIKQGGLPTDVVIVHPYYLIWIYPNIFCPFTVSIMPLATGDTNYSGMNTLKDPGPYLQPVERRFHPYHITVLDAQ